MRLLCRLWDIDKNDPKISNIAQKLGADVPACLTSETLYGDGKGDGDGRDDDKYDDDGDESDGDGVSL